MKAASIKPVRCAIYTRVSTELSFLLTHDQIPSLEEVFLSRFRPVDEIEVVVNQLDPRDVFGGHDRSAPVTLVGNDAAHVHNKKTRGF
jgi:hypothetical protein